MFNMDYYLSFYLFIMSSFMFSYYFKHLLLTIISLEFIMISVFFNMFNILMNLENEMFLIFMFLVMSVCEGALGLSLIVLMVRLYGNDYLNSLMVLLW